MQKAAFGVTSLSDDNDETSDLLKNFTVNGTMIIIIGRLTYFLPTVLWSNFHQLHAVSGMAACHLFPPTWTFEESELLWGD